MDASAYITPAQLRAGVIKSFKAEQIKNLQPLPSFFTMSCSCSRLFFINGGGVVCFLGWVHDSCV